MLLSKTSIIMAGPSRHDDGNSLLFFKMEHKYFCPVPHCAKTNSKSKNYESLRHWDSETLRPWRLRLWDTETLKLWDNERMIKYLTFLDKNFIYATVCVQFQKLKLLSFSFIYVCVIHLMTPKHRQRATTSSAVGFNNNPLNKLWPAENCRKFIGAHSLFRKRALVLLFFLAYYDH